MNITEGKPIQLFSKYLFAAFGSAIVMSIYSFIDALCIGQYEGEIGTAALAVVMPLWTIIFSTGLLFGISGATLMVERRGRGQDKEGNQFYTIAMIGACFFALILWILVNIIETPLLTLFGASDIAVLEKAKKYVFWMKISLPVFLFSQVLTCFIRNDGAPLRATIAVISGGVINTILDFSLVFGAKMGISGAGLATMCGQIVNLSVLLSHYFSKKRGIYFVKPVLFLKRSLRIIQTGLPSFVLDIAMGILAILFNNQIVSYNEDEKQTATLAVYGVVCNIVALVQSLGYAVGQATQPLISENLGAGKLNRVSKFLKYAILTSLIIAGVVVLLLELILIPILEIFTREEEDSLILTIAASIQRKYYISFLFLSFNVLCIYYFQSILKSNIAFIISILRGMFFSTLFLFVLPLLFGFDAIWFTMLCTEGVICILNLIFMWFSRRKQKLIEE